MTEWMCCFCSIEDILRDTDSELEADDDDVNAAGKGKKSKAKKASKEPKSEAAAWLREGAEDEDIVDFLDPSIVKKITGLYEIIDLISTQSRTQNYLELRG